MAVPANGAAYHTFVYWFCWLAQDSSLQTKDIMWLYLCSLPVSFSDVFLLTLVALIDRFVVTYDVQENKQSASSKKCSR
jgi:hypothetical protein